MIKVEKKTLTNKHGKKEEINFIIIRHILEFLNTNSHSHKIVK